MQAFYIFVVSLLLTLNSRGEASGSVFFIDGSNNQYIRPRSSSQVLPVSPAEISAAVSALLGFAPPASLTADGSSKLNRILKPNPFERPRATFVLEIAGADEALVETYNTHPFLGNALRSSISSDSYKADIELSESEVAVVSINEASSDVTDKDINDFAVNLHEDLSHGIERPAALTIGRFGGINALSQEYGQSKAKQGMDVLLATVSKLFDLLETSHKGQIVGVIVLDESVNQESANLLSIEYSSGSSARSMAEVGGTSNPIIIAEILLVRLTLAWLTGILLLIATLLGVYFLMYMPLTKVTLLYSNVKLD